MCDIKIQYQDSKSVTKIKSIYIETIGALENNNPTFLAPRSLFFVYNDVLKCDAS